MTPLLSAEVIILLAVAAGCLLLGRTLRLPAIVAYLVGGVLAGPGGLGLVSRSEAIVQLAELGVALLLFGVGIEFALDRLRGGLARMLVGGGAQVTLTTLLTAGGAVALGASWPLATFTGFLVSLSSTAIVFKLYEDDGEIEAPHGQAAAGILLLQDLALVPMILLVPVLGAPPDGMLLAAARALLEAAGALALVLLLARAVLPRALVLVARAGIPELFPLAALVAAFGTALCAVRLGLSVPIGTFLAGLALSGSPYAHQVFAEVVPLRDAFVALFFTVIGTLIDPTILVHEPGAIVGLTAAVLAKGAIVAAVTGLLWRSSRIAILTGVGLCQIGEFSFVLSHHGVEAGILTPHLEQAFLAAAMVTMAATPFLMRAGRRFELLVARGGGSAPPAVRDHVLVLGYGTTGQAVARVLHETGVRFLVVDMLADHVEAGRKVGMPIRFGDATRRAVLEEMGASRARAAVVTVGEPRATRRIVSLLRQIGADMHILVRARRVAEIAELERLGADEVIPSEFETSIELFVRLLTRLGVPRHVVRIQESLIRAEHYRVLRGLGTTVELLAATKSLVAGGILETAQVMAGSAAQGRTLAELDLRRRTGAMVLSLVRGDVLQAPPDGPTRLVAGDLVVLYGPHEAIDRALHLLEPATDGGSPPGAMPDA